MITKGNKKAILNKMKEQLRLYNSSDRPWYREVNLMKKIATMSKKKTLKKVVAKIDSEGIIYDRRKLTELTLGFIDQMDKGGCR